MPDKIRVACVTQGIPHFEVPLLRLCAGQSDWAFRVFSLGPAPARVRWDSEYGQEIWWGDSLVEGYYSLPCPDLRALISEVDRFRPDAIISYGYAWSGARHLALASRRRGAPLIHRGPLNHFRDPRRPRWVQLLRPLRRFPLRLFAAHHYSGAHSARVLLGAGIPREDLFFVPYSVDSNFFLKEVAANAGAGEALRASLGFGPEDWVVLFIAQHNWFKGPDIAMRIFAGAQHRDARVQALIVGSGRETTAMKAYAERHLRDGSYHFAGFIPSKETVKYYLASDLVIFPSRYETWARAVNEAMLCGRIPVVNRIIPASGSLVRDGESGFVVDGPRASAYLDAMFRFFDLTRQERKRMEQVARRDAASQSYENHVADLRASVDHAFARRSQFGDLS